MAPSLLVCVLLLPLMQPLGSATACQLNSNSNVSCHFNCDRAITCEWATDCTNKCSIKAHRLNINNLTNFVNINSSCALGPTVPPGLRRCSLLFEKTDTIRPRYVLSLNLSCIHIPQSWVTKYRPWNHTKLDAPGRPVVSGSNLSWTKEEVLDYYHLLYEMQWTPQHHSWAGGWKKTLQLRECPPQCRAELRADSLVLGHNYNARVRVRVDPRTFKWSLGGKWSEWSPTLSWTSAVGRYQEPSRHGSEGKAKDVGLWTAVSVVTFTVGLVIVLFWMSRVHWVYIMKVVKGAPLPSPASSVIRMGWQPPLFSSDSYITFFKPVDIITSVELLTPESRPSPDCPLAPDEKLPSLSGHSSFSNPMYSQLCSQHTSHPDPEPDPESEGPQEDPGLASCPDLDLILLLSMAHQSQGVPVVCEYEKVEALGAHGSGRDSDWGLGGDRGDRGRLTSVDSGMGSGEEVSQDSLLLEDHTVVGSSSVEDQAVVSKQATGHAVLVP